MAKWDERHAGSSCHVHMSLWDAGGGPLSRRVARRRRRSATSSAACSPTRASSRWFFAPTVNSYKRYSEGTFAPTRITWSVDNRTAGFRVVGAGPSLRVECRIPGADANPYLTYAALLAAGLDGIERKLDPGEPFAGDVYRSAELPRVPHTLADAIRELEGSALRTRRLRRRRRGSPAALRAHGARQLRSGRHRLRARALLRAHLSRRAMRRPLIGITCYHREGAERPRFAVPASYVDAVRAGGGRPVLFPPGDDDPAALLDGVDGVVLCGGGDIDPSRFGGAASHDAIYSTCPERDAFELALVQECLRRDTPTLAICRGLQVLNVARGGDLHVHLPDVVGDSVAHRVSREHHTHHPVRIDASSRLAAVLGAPEVMVASWHHQAIDRLGAGLRAVAWAEDGTVEAVEVEDDPAMLAIQWHPELQVEEPDGRQLRLFEELVALARRGPRAAAAGPSVAVRVGARRADTPAGGPCPAARKIPVAAVPSPARRLHLAFDDPKAFQQEYARNLERGGAFVATTDAFELREVVEVLLEADFGDEKLVLAAEVVHAGGGGVAVQFLDPAPELRSRLESLVEGAERAIAEAAAVRIDDDIVVGPADDEFGDVDLDEESFDLDGAGAETVGWLRGRRRARTPRATPTNEPSARAPSDRRCASPCG